MITTEEDRMFLKGKCNAQKKKMNDVDMTLSQQNKGVKEHTRGSQKVFYLTNFCLSDFYKIFAQPAFACHCNIGDVKF